MRIQQIDLFFNKTQETEELMLVQTIEDLPPDYERRGSTDIFCVIVGIVFSIFMVVMAIVLFNFNNYYQVNFPADSKGLLCGIEKPTYPYIYFANPPHITRRVCVQQCPSSDKQSLKCIPNDDTGCAFSGFSVRYYPNEAVQTRSGFFCFPKDEALRNQLEYNSKLKGKELTYNSLDTIMISFFVAIGISFLYFVLVQLFPDVMNYASVIVGGIIVLVTAVLLFGYKTEQTALKIVAGVILLLFTLIIVMTVLKNRDSWQMHAIFLSYSAKMIKQRMATLLYIPLFFMVLLAFSIIVILEFWSYWSHGNVTFDASQDLFYQLQGAFPMVLSVLLGMQTIWGLSFIKQSFNFCVSGQAINWYYDKEPQLCLPFKLLFCKHFGSVIAGSFITGLLSVYDLIFDLIKPDENALSDGSYAKCYQKGCQCCYKVLDLVRSDAMAFIYLSGNPFCNSARYCTYLCDRSVIMDYSQSTSRAYRICSHFLLMGIMAIFAMYVKGSISLYALLIIMIQTLYISNLFISIHADAVEAIKIVFLTDQFFHRKNSPSYDIYIQQFTSNYQIQLKEEVRSERQRQRQRLNN